MKSRKKVTKKIATIEKSIDTFQELKKEEKNNLLRIYDFLTNSLRKELKKRPSEFLIIFFVVLVSTIIFSGVLITLITGGFNIKYTTPSIAFPNFSLPNILGAQLAVKRNSDSKLDPLTLIEMIKSGDETYALIDIRSLEEYERGHIKTAISMPVYGTELVDKSGKIDKKRIRKALDDKFADKDMIIIYGHSQHSTLTSEVAFSDEGRALPLAIGWNEWAHFKSLWIPESMWNEVELSDYIQVREN